ncbi:hypothetical protein ACWF94_28565 [Streptomyces sp. NPDC055078]
MAHTVTCAERLLDILALPEADCRLRGAFAEDVPRFADGQRLEVTA